MIAPIFIFDSREKWFPVGVEESLAHYGYKWEGDTWKPGGRINFPSDMKQLDLPAVGYHRVKESGGLFWHQYWLWYQYNSWEIAGVGNHEGDWEFVQIGCATIARPVLVTCSQHHSGAGRMWSLRCEVRDKRLVVYVARGSHANFFSVGKHKSDVCDGRGRVLDDVEWRDFGPWVAWPGLWGNSTGRGASPQSPGRQGHRWASPATFHDLADGRHD